MSDRNYELEAEEAYKALRASTENSDLYSFTTVLTDEEYEEEQREHNIEVAQIAQEIMEDAKSKSNESFPDFMWKPIVNTFDDEYDFDYVTAALSGESEIMMLANTLKNKYQDYFEWQDALSIWYDYRMYVEETYGSWEYYKEAVQEGLLSAIVHNKPKLKKNRNNKGLEKIKFALSREDPDEVLDYDMLRIITDALPDIHEGIENDESVEAWEIARIVNDEEKNKIARDDRVRNIYKRGIQNSTNAVDAMLQFLRSEDDSRGYSFKGSLAEEIEAMHDNDLIDPEILQHELGAMSSTITIDSSSDYYSCDTGAFMTGYQRDIEEFFTALASNGYDAMGFLNGVSMDKEAQRRLKSNIIRNGGQMTEKQMKKFKKRQKKAAKRMMDKLNSDSKIRNVLIPNKIDLSKGFDDLDLTFTIEDMIRGG